MPAIEHLTQPLDISPESLADEITGIMDFVEALRSESEAKGARLHVPRPMAPGFENPAEARAACEQELSHIGFC